MIGDVRMLTGEPRSQEPSTRVVFYAILRVVQSAFNQLSNTNHAWATGETVITVTPNVADYEMGVTGFGKALSIVTQDNSNPAHIERLVDFTEIQDLDVGWDLPNDAGMWATNWDGSNHTAQRIGFYKAAGFDTTYMRLKPTPQRACDYRILYSIGNWVDDASLTDSPVLAEHHHLFEVRAALHLLPHCVWSDDEAFNVNKRRELALALKDEEAMYGSDWSRYIGNMRIDHISTRYTMSID